MNQLLRGLVWQGPWVLVPVVGPNLALVNVGDAEQTFDTLIGQNLVDRYHLTVPPG